MVLKWHNLQFALRLYGKYLFWRSELACWHVKMVIDNYNKFYVYVLSAVV